MPNILGQSLNSGLSKAQREAFGVRGQWTVVREDGTRPCRGCGLILPLSCFGKGAKRAVSRSRCKKCEVVASGIRARANPKKVRDYRIKSVYNLTPEQTKAMFDRQRGSCAICFKPLDFNNPKGSWAIDHNHATGKVRGILCYNCNRGLGAFFDNQDILSRAALYVHKG